MDDIVSAWLKTFRRGCSVTEFTVLDPAWNRQTRFSPASGGENFTLMVGLDDGKATAAAEILPSWSDWMTVRC